ncbi:MAG TPA: DUF2147 domain-containing protein [Caulobacteraceae bacterium]
MRFASLPLFAAILTFAPLAATASSAVGDWLTADRGAVIRVARCGADLCGTIVWLKDRTDPATGRPVVDVANPDPALRDHPILGLRILSAFKPAGEDRWTGGRIYNPDSGRSYRANLSLRANGDLAVQGCLAVFCHTQKWTPTR